MKVSKFENLPGFSLKNLDLPFAPSPVMEFQDPATAIIGSKLILGYLTFDPDCPNPLFDSDGYGSIFTSHRHSKTHWEMQQALGLNSDWEPDLELLDKFPDRLRQCWIDAASQHVEFCVWADQTARSSTKLDRTYYRRRASKLWAESYSQYQEFGQTSYEDFAFTTDVMKSLWNDLRNERLIGDPDLVMLDCYQHGGDFWSISGHGRQCPWDTSKGVGVWVPYDEQREEIIRLSAVYAYGCVKHNGSWTLSSGNKRYYAQLDEMFGGGLSPQFLHWQDAFDWLAEKSVNLKLPTAKTERLAIERKARLTAGAEIAQSALDIYNTWLNGGNYGVVICEFQNQGTSENPIWEFVESDEFWGYIGEDYAMAEAISSVQYSANRLLSKAA